ncbi:MAG TPA: glycoside hydrolase family 15 protein [Candidatus Saccharimonadales bacterium]
MSRPVFLSNGSMAVGLNRFGLVNDLYYPYVGLENHVGNKDLFHRVGLFVDGTISWLGDVGWEVTVDYRPDSLISQVSAQNDGLKIKLEFSDFVDSQRNVFARQIALTNQATNRRDIKLFLHQVFRISDSQRDDTAQYLPEEQVVMHYKGRRVFVISGELADASTFDQHAIGLNGIEGHTGTYADAADGELSGNNVEHGRVDSTLRFSLNIDANSTGTLNYWIAAGASQKDALDAHRQFVNKQLNDRLEDTQAHWQQWLAVAANQLHKVDPKYHQQTLKSLLIIKSHIDRRGAVIASGDSEMLNYTRDYYSYCWPRDACYVLWPLIRLGYKDEPRAYFEFARDVIHPDGYLMHKYQPDRAIGSSWHPYLNSGRPELPIQEDETAITLFLLGEYLKHTNDKDFVLGLYDTMVQPMANFIDSFIDSATKLPHASYDLWEEKFMTTTYTTAVVHAGLQAAAELAEKFEYPDDAIRWRTVADDIKQAARETLFNHDIRYFYKGFLLGENDMLSFDPVIDASSLYGAVMFGLYDKDDPYVKQAVDTLKARLVDKTPSGGVPRYESDHYHAVKAGVSNPWFVTTLWYAQYLIDQQDKETAADILGWTQRHMLTSGALPEQLHPYSDQHLSVEPLIWSSAEFINTALDISE